MFIKETDDPIIIEMGIKENKNKYIFSILLFIINFSLQSIYRLFLNILIPFSYLLAVAITFFGPKKFGFGFNIIVAPALLIGFFGLILWTIAMINLGSSFTV